MIGLARDNVAVLFRRLEEAEGRTLLTLAERVEGEEAGCLYHLVGSGIDFNPYDYQGPIERGMRHPIDGGGGGIAVLGGQNLDTVGDHSQRNFLIVVVHNHHLR